MALSSRRPARRSIITAAVGLLTLGFLAWCAGNNTSSSSQSTAAAGTSDQTTSMQLTSGDEDRLGCADYCQNAGGYGGAGGTSRHPAVTVSSGTVTADPDGYVPVPLTCHLSVQCRGVLHVGFGPSFSFGGRSDLVVDAGATRTLGVQVGSSAIDFLRSNGPTTMDVTTDARDSGMVNGSPGGIDAIGLDQPLTVAAPG